MKTKFPNTFLFFTVSLGLLVLVACGPVAPLPTTPTATPPAGVTIVPAAGDLGWGAVHGKIVDANTGLPVEGAVVKCEHFSYTSTYLCKGITTTNRDGLYVFLEVFFHDTDRITLSVEAPGYAPVRFEQSFFTQPDLRADLKLFLSGSDTPAPTPTMTVTNSSEPLIVCTAQPCPDGGFTCNGICPSATPSP